MTKQWKACKNCGHTNNDHEGENGCIVTVAHPMILGGPKKCSCRKFKPNE